jgi:hypothetical protein
MDPEVLHFNGIDYVPKAHCDGLGNEIRKQTETIQKMLGYHVDDERRIRKAESIIGDISGDIAIFTKEMRGRILAFLAGSAASGGTDGG